MDLGLNGRVAIVTGASRGIGAATTTALRREGCEVLAVARGAEALQAISGVLGPEEDHREPAGRVVPFAADVTAPDGPTSIIAACIEAFGRVDVLVNNAGGAEPRRLDRLDDEAWRAAFELNFFAAVRMSAAALPEMRARRWGRLVHVASVSGREPDPLFAPYSAAKAAMLNYSTSLSQAYAADGVLSSCVVPGVTLTELVADNASAASARLGSSPDEVMATMLQRHRVAAGRFGEVDEVAAAIVFLASERASWITGATLEVDGGTLRSV